MLVLGHDSFHGATFYTGIDARSSDMKDDGLHGRPKRGEIW